MSSLEYLDEERKKIWKKISDTDVAIEKLSEEVLKKTSDYEAEAKASAANVVEILNACKSRQDDLNGLLEKTKATADDFSKSAQVAQAQSNDISSGHEQVKGILDELEKFTSEIETKKDALLSSITQLEAMFAKYPAYAEHISSLSELYKSASDSATKLDSALTQATGRKNEIDKIYYEVMGYKTKDPETGIESEVTGLKAELESAYDDLHTGADALSVRIQDLEKQAGDRFVKYSEEKTLEFGTLATKWSDEYAGVLNRINELLPNALTTGLSYAYADKKTAELRESARLEKNFMRAIGALIIVSLFPFAVAMTFLFNGFDLSKALFQMPRTVVALLPLYIPVMWVAYSTSKKLNLSKRLVEEYTHKEVLSRTFEGLAYQIGTLPDSAIASDLRTRLLYNILEVSSENPGKLISDYNKADHPLMDALDKSVQLGTAVEKVAKIPGMSKLADFLERRAESVLSKNAEHAVTGLGAVEKKQKDAKP